MRTINSAPNFNQQGVTLVVAIIVLLALTMLGLASTTDNRMQSVMVRNDQFKFDVFNASYSEINAQIDIVNNRALADGIPNEIFSMINGGVGTEITSIAGSLTVLTPISDVSSGGVTYTGIGKDVMQKYSTPCFVIGESIAVGSSTNSCFEFLIQADSDLTNTSISSTQNQVYQYITPDLSEG